MRFGFAATTLDVHTREMRRVPSLQHVAIE
jgi:hypothetical protein